MSGVAQNVSPHFEEVDNHCALSGMEWGRDHQGQDKGWQERCLGHSI